MSKTALLVFPLLSSIACASSQATADDQRRTTIRMDVNLVVINVTVSGNDGKAVTGLGQDAFRLFVEDAARPINLFRGEDTPVAVGIVVDNSASMGPKRAEVIAAALAFARSSNPHDQMFVVHFNEHARFGLPPSKPFTDNIAELETALSQFVVAGTTALYDAVGMALSHLGRASIDRKILILITDGADNSSQASLTDIVHWAQESSVTFYCIGIFDDADEMQGQRPLHDFAELTGGRAFFPANVEHTTNLCVQIAHEIRSQYTLGFAGAEDGKYHRIRVTAQDRRYDKLNVHTRPGYFAAKP